MAAKAHHHRIIPGHLGGTYEPSNVILLTIEEHAEVHRKMYEQDGRWQDYVAWQGLSGRIGKEEIIRLVIINANKGKKHTEETKRKMSIARKGKPKSEEHRRNMSIVRIGEKNPMYGKSSWNKGKKTGPRSEESKNKQSIAMKGRKNMIPQTEAWKQKQSLSKKGKPWTEARRLAQIKEKQI